jgi:tetratricopeptide (TPR) repeat protein
LLEVAYERSVRRIAAEVTERPRGSLYLAVGRSAEVRAAVEAALGERGITIAGVTLRGDEGPWARILAAHEQGGVPGGEIVLSVAGLGDVAEDKLDGILAHLDLGRELRVAHRLHVVLWVGGLARLDHFRTMAPDLWGHRSGVGLFLSSKDFEVAPAELEPGDVPKSFETLLRETEEELASSPKPVRRINLLTDKALWLQNLGRADEALQAVEEAEGVLTWQAMSGREQADARARVVLGKLNLLEGTGLTQDALTYATIEEQRPDGDPTLRFVIQASLARAYDGTGRVAESLACFAKALDLVPALPIAPNGGRGRPLVSRAAVFEQQGAFDAAVRDAIAASEEVERLGKRNEKDNAWRPSVLSAADRVLAKVSLAQGDTLSAMEYAHRGVARTVGLDAKGRVSAALNPVAQAYRGLGLFSDARHLARRAIELLGHSPGEIAGWTRWLGARDADEQRLDVAIVGYESSVWLYRTAAGTEHRPHRRASWLRGAARVLYEDLAPLADATRCFQEAEELLTLAGRAADEAASPEQRALTQWSRASLASAAEQWDRAEAELLAVLAFAEANWGPYKRAEVLLDLARVIRDRGDLARAAEHAERAQRGVAIDPPEYRNRFTAIDAARELGRIRKAQGDLVGAHEALAGALAIAEGDRLRLREREVRLDLAELPPPPGARDQRLEHAQRARAIAQDAAFPVDEAEAMLVLAELHLDAGGARRARTMFEQAVWIVDRIGPPAIRERASRLRTRLDG